MSINNQELLRMDRLITSGIPAGFIVLGVLYSYSVKNYLLNLMGDSSYSLYLVQAFSIPFSYKVAAKFFQDLNPGLIFLICLLLSLGASIALYLIVEKKITRKLKVFFIK